MSNVIIPLIQSPSSENRRAISPGDMSSPPSSSRLIATCASISLFQSHAHLRMSSLPGLGIQLPPVAVVALGTLGTENHAEASRRRRS